MITKTRPPVSFEERLNAAQSTADAAVSVVETIARDLETAADEKSLLIIEIGEEIERLDGLIDQLETLRAEAVVAEADSLAKASNIRTLICS